MNELHEANRRGWDAISSVWQSKVDAVGVWRSCSQHPELVFAAEELVWLRGVSGTRVAVLGSGDNLAAFALAGLGATVTSIDISQEQLDCGAVRARELELEIEFIRADVTDLGAIPGDMFDVVYTGGHVAVWVSDLNRYYAEAARILSPGGLLVVSEYHPFRRVFSGNAGAYEVDVRYLDRGPFEYDRAQDNAVAMSLAGPLPSYQFHWTVSDMINAVVGSGCEVVECREFGDAISEWECLPSGDLPEVLLIVGKKR